jgi:serine/threonine-protein kinase
VAENPADAIAAERTARPADATTEPPPPTRAAPTPPAAKGGRDVRAAAAATATGQVQLAVSPWGTVEVDGRPAGTTPPLTQLTLPEGKHTITLRNADLPPKTLTVHVKAGQPATVRHRFTP